MNEDVSRTFPIAGMLLRDAVDPMAAAGVVEGFIRGAASSLELAEAGVSERRVVQLSGLLPPDRDDLRSALQLGAAWALGLRSSPSSTDTWYPVLSGMAADGDWSRATAETALSLIMAARRALRLFAPYVDRPGLDPLLMPLRQAADRGVRVEIAFVARLDRDQSTQVLKDLARASTNVAVYALPVVDRFPHLKVISADAMKAYVGSANLTWGGLVSNLEIGALVEGPRVEVLERALDLLLADEVSTRGAGGSGGSRLEPQ